MLTGKFREELVTTQFFSWTENKYIDDHPFIWQDFQRKGYITAFLEDFNLWGAFENKLEGFKVYKILPLFLNGERFILSFSPVYANRSLY